MTHPGRLALSCALFSAMMGYAAWRTEAVLHARRAFMQGDYSDASTRRVVCGFALLTIATLLAPAWVDGLRPSGLALAGPIAIFFGLAEAAYCWKWPRFAVQRAVGAMLLLGCLMPIDDPLFRVVLAVFGLVMLFVPGMVGALDVGSGSRAEVLQHTRIVAITATVVTSAITLFLCYEALTR